ncbi:hypothetical protein AA0473_2470 [Acetobacter orleanensis NRIC 0473]|uniref:Uncharacterized protein n=1 Tax=Acetobacter orleanensis TaxID=104099 RepID=A0A4Y3TP88_9PROT|nr:hypothetical protein Abol_015_109 [Acetobacter orleanensis JCM 7639]GBR31185.1 hypothetical protein AA0473_2470 [Acetobacter orleanensis NRIC 0473]GEB82837.1 hypothetical protein AOR01nite_13140 [Acetobacter orleanensis]
MASYTTDGIGWLIGEAHHSKVRQPDLCRGVRAWALYGPLPVPPAFLKEKPGGGARHRLRSGWRQTANRSGAQYA